MRKIVAVSLLASALLLVGFGGGASAETRAGLSEANRSPSTAPTPAAKPLVDAKRALAKAARVHCRRVGCFNKAINNLATSLNGLIGAYNGVVGCLATTPVTQYNAYWYGSGGFYTTALDFTEAGDIASRQMVIRTC